MDNRLIACLVLGAVAFLATLVLIWKRRCRETGLLCIRETWMTAVLGLMLLALGFAFPILKAMDPTAAGTDARSYWFVAGFGLACHCLGDFALLFTCVKCTVLHEDRCRSLFCLRCTADPVLGGCGSGGEACDPFLLCSHRPGR